ncbi:MAG: hypothetical protein Q9228_004742 [Teloschistes exilis]
MLNGELHTSCVYKQPAPGCFGFLVGLVRKHPRLQKAEAIVLTYTSPPTAAQASPILLPYHSPIMEGRANSQNYSPPDEMSHVRLDLKGTHPNQESPANCETSTMFRRALPKGRKPRVCVVGAGMAGMRCAQVLGDKGIDVTVLEARDRTGGRVGLPRSLQGLLLTEMAGSRCIRPPSVGI